MRTPIVELRVGATSCGIAPEIGCAVKHFRTDDDGEPLDWVRPYDPGHRLPVPSAASGCFPLVPYSGRIAHGVLRWRGRSYRLPVGLLADPHALDGTGWTEPWKVQDVAPDRATFSLAYAGADWPFPFEASLAYALRPGRLVFSIGITNSCPMAVPFGLGLHPIFAGLDLRLRADAAKLWQIDGAKLFARTSPVSPPWDFRYGAPLRGSGLEHGFSEWNGVFELTWPGRRQTLTVTASQPLRHLVIYSRLYDDTDAGFVCVEPVSHCVDGFNLAGRGVDDTGTGLLSPGESRSAEVEFRIVD